MATTHEIHGEVGEEHLTHQTLSLSTYVKDGKVAVDDSDTIQQQVENDEIPDEQKPEVKFSQTFVIPRVKSLHGFRALFKSDEDAVSFLQKKVEAHCETRAKNLMRGQDKDGSFKFENEVSEKPYDLTSYVGTPLREALSDEVKLRRMLEKMFPGDTEMIKNMLRTAGFEA